MTLLERRRRRGAVLSSKKIQSFDQIDWFFIHSSTWPIQSNNMIMQIPNHGRKRKRDVLLLMLEEASDAFFSTDLQKADVLVRSDLENMELFRASESSEYIDQQLDKLSAPLF